MYILRQCSLFIDHYKNDPYAFIFTLKNPQGVDPKRFMKRKETYRAIMTHITAGPVFGNSDLFVGAKCKNEHYCSIKSDIDQDYEYDPQYKSSLFTDWNEQEQAYSFAIYDYEVFKIHNYEDYVKKNCRYADLILDDTHSAPLPDHPDEQELFKELNRINNDKPNLRLTLSQRFLAPHTGNDDCFPESKVIDNQYDTFFKGLFKAPYKTQLLYRASDHSYTSASFHAYCDQSQYATMIIIKTFDGWTFGGYTTKSWSSSQGIFYSFAFIH